MRRSLALTCPNPDSLCLSFRSEGRNETLVLVTLPGALRLGVVDERPRGASASPALTQLRRHVEGARIELVATSQRAARISLSRAGTTRYLIAAPSKPYGAWWLWRNRRPGRAGALRQAPAIVPAEDGHLDAKGPRGAARLWGGGARRPSNAPQGTARGDSCCDT